ncbi:inner-membrane translocator [Streptomyces luteogriseus]|uniref:inner-membrane translocator n=1 Tax=Streptomyces luteogriseus TaxID=68233 RepID=UPI0036E482F4
MADAGAGPLVAIPLAARGPGRTGAGSGRAAADSAPLPHWAPVPGFGGLAPALGATAAVLLRIGHRGVGPARLTLASSW